jgi:hypothetical protein
VDLRRVGWLAVTSTSLAVLGVVVPILYDRYKTSSALELRHVSTTTVVGEVAGLEKLSITYGGRPIPAVSKLSFLLMNSGRTPLREADLVGPPTVRLLGNVQLLDFHEDGSDPPELTYHSSADTAKREYALTFPLLNPGDAIRFSLLVAAPADLTPKFTASARISGIKRLSVTRLTTTDSSQKLSRRAELVLAATSILSLLFLLGLVGFGYELHLRELVRKGALQLQRPATPANYISLVQKALAPTKLDFELRELRAYLASLPLGQEVSPEEASEITDLMRNAVSNLTFSVVGLVIIGAFCALGFWYVISSL